MSVKEGGKGNEDGDEMLVRREVGTQVGMEVEGGGERVGIGGGEGSEEGGGKELQIEVGNELGKLGRTEARRIHLSNFARGVDI